MLRWSIVGFGLGLLIAFAPSCGPTKPQCSSSNCFGCCDVTGACQLGTSASFCGAGGAVCASCSAGQACVGGACQAASAGCSATCSGCCDSSGHCQTPGVGQTANAACGTSGHACVACTGSQSCNANGACQNTGNCTGCIDSTNTCQPGTTGTACGTNGATCIACTGGATCQNGVCTGGCGPSTCGSGCCDSSGNCLMAGSAQQGQHNCGNSGAACGDCGTGTCTATGACQGGSCNASNCAQGCCNGGACVVYAQQNNNSCGTGGAACTGCTTGLTCSGGACATGSCNSTNCPAGCCAGNSCVLYANQNASQCGASGAQCSGCSGSQTCNTSNGTCQTATGCNQSSTGGTLGFVNLSSNNALPTPWNVTDASILKSDLSGAGASVHIGDLTVLNVTSSSSSNPCPLPFTSSTGKTYCDGFNAMNSGNTVVVDTFAYFGTSNKCGGNLVDAGTGQTYSTIRGIWQDNYSPDAGDIWVLAPTDCSDLGLTPNQNCPAGCTGTPPVSCDINAVLGGSPVAGTIVTVRGVVTGRWTSTKGWGLVIQDTMSGNTNDAIQVHNAADSGVNGGEPVVGDYVKITGSLSHPGSKYWELQL